MIATPSLDLIEPLWTRQYDRDGPLPYDADRAFRAAVAKSMRHPRGHDLTRHFSAPSQERLLLSGWAARICDLADGRRQIVTLLLPGDLLTGTPRTTPMSAIITLTKAETCEAPDEMVSPSLQAAYAAIRRNEHDRLTAHVIRLGRMSAQERIGDFAVELFERIAGVQSVRGGSVPAPLTQDMIGDLLGLTAVHVNRMLQNFRKEGLLIWGAGALTIPDVKALKQQF